MKLERINEIERTAGNLVDATARRVLINLRVGIVVFGTNISSRSYIFHFESWAAVAVDAAVGVVEWKDFKVPAFRAEVIVGVLAV